MKVREIIKHLQQQNPELEVSTLPESAILIGIETPYELPLAITTAGKSVLILLDENGEEYDRLAEKSDFSTLMKLHLDKLEDVKKE